MPESTNSAIRRGALHSGDTGTHTCTVNDNDQGRAGIASIVMNIKGKGYKLQKIDESFYLVLLVYCGINI